MKIICILQNAWGDRELPLVFSPNPFNKSAKVIKKMTGGDHTIYFCNTTGVVTRTAAEGAKPDYEHFEKVIKRLPEFDMILVCGKQAEATVHKYLKQIVVLNKPLIYVAHPASRSLSNIQIKLYNELINKDNGTI